MLNRFYRYLLIAAAGFTGGLLLYAILPDPIPFIGEPGAALWSWFLIFACGAAAHFALPKSDLSQVSKVLLAILASVSTAVLCAWSFMMLVDFPARDGVGSQLLLVTFAALTLAALVFIPIYLISRRLQRSLGSIYLVSGALVPGGLILVLRPFGDIEFFWVSTVALVLGLIGAAAAWAFLVTVHHSWTDSPEQS